MKKLIITIFIFTVAITGIYGQRHAFIGSWEVNFPTNADYIKKTSFAGGKLEYRYIIKDKFSVGLAFNWASYEDYIPRQTFEKPDGSGAITGDFIPQAYQVPITATGHYYFKKGKIVWPYAGIALGAQSLQQSVYYNVYVSEDDNWGFVARPEVGAFFLLGQGNWGMNLGLSYSFATNKTELIDKNSFTNFGINLGFVFLSD